MYGTQTTRLRVLCTPHSIEKEKKKKNTHNLSV